MYSEPISPLKHGRTYVRNIMTFAKHKLPVVYIPSPMCGATAPVTVAGGIIQANAETLSGNVIMQLTNEKSPFIYGADMTIMDMRTGVFSYGAPEWMLANIAMAQLGRHYGMPIWSTGGCSDSKIFDSQAALEAALTLFVAAASGANLIHDFGFLDFGMTGSLELATLCDELASLIERVLRGIDVTDITIALEQMEKAGPGGHFLTQRHTLQLYKKEHWFPGLLDRRRRADWTLDGSKKLVQRTREKTRKILEVHGPAPLPGATEKELDNLVKGAEKALST